MVSFSQALEEFETGTGPLTAFSGGKYICAQCGRTSDDKSELCSPTKVQ